MNGYAINRLQTTIPNPSLHVLSPEKRFADDGSKDLHECMYEEKDERMHQANDRSSQFKVPKSSMKEILQWLPPQEFKVDRAFRSIAD
jgi:hypothetical protein